MISIKELADSIGISKVAVSKRIDKLGLRSELVKDGNKYLMADEVADEVRKSYQYKTDTTTPGKSDQPESSEVLQVFTNQLEVKDRQIEELQAEIRKLTDTLAEMNRSIQQSQFLLAEKTDTIPHEVNAEVVGQEPTYQKNEKVSFTDKIRFWSKGRSK